MRAPAGRRRSGRLTQVGNSLRLRVGTRGPAFVLRIWSESSSRLHYKAFGEGTGWARRSAERRAQHVRWQRRGRFERGTGTTSRHAPHSAQRASIHGPRPRLTEYPCCVLCPRGDRCVRRVFRPPVFAQDLVVARRRRRLIDEALNRPEVMQNLQSERRRRPALTGSSALRRTTGRSSDSRPMAGSVTSSPGSSAATWTRGPMRALMTARARTT